MTEQTVKEKIAAFLKLPIEQVDTDKAVADLVADSFMMVELMLTLQEEFDIELATEDLTGVTTVGELIKVVSKKVQARHSLVA